MVQVFSATSMYYNTPVNTFGREMYVARDIPFDSTDELHAIDPQYAHNAGLMAMDLFGDENLRWVFLVMNRNDLKDLIFDFTEGKMLIVPKKERLLALLGA